MRSIVLTFSKPIQGRNRIVSISALAPLPETAAWALPRIEAQQVRWEQQSAWLQLASPLALRRLELEQARQIPPRETLSAEEVPIGVQYLASTARIELEIDRQPAEYEATSGTTVLLGGGGAKAEIRAHVRPTTRELFELRAEVARGWNISSVEAEDRELVHDWQIRRSPTAGRMLEVRFARPLDPRTPARLRIQARRQLGVGAEAIPLVQLRPLTFSASVPGPRHFLAVLPEENLMTVFSGDEQMTWLILDDLDNVEAPLVQVQSRDPIIPLDSQYENVFVALRPLPPDELPFVADVQIIARLTPKELLEQYRLALDGSPAAAGPLRVRLSPPRDEEVRWFSEQNPQRTLPARRVTEDGSTPGELWEIDWPESSEATRGVMLGERTSSSSVPLNVSLLRVQGAQQQEGTVWIEAPGELPLEFRHSPLLIPVPVGRDDYRQFHRSRRAFRFASSAEVLQPGQGLSVTLASSSPALGRPPVLIWRATLEACLDPSGVIRSQAWVQLENDGAAELRAQMPADARLRRVLINGSEAKYSTLESGALSVPLPEENRFPLLQLVYDRSETTRAWWSPVALTAPAFDAPLLDQQWLIWVAPDFVLHDRSASPQPRDFRDCAARVLGPLLRLPFQTPV